MKNENKNEIQNKNESQEIQVQKTPKFGLLDFAIILLVIISVVGVYFRFNVIDMISQNANTKTYEVSFSIKGIRYTTPNYFNVNDDVYVASSGELLGRILQNPNEDKLPSVETFIENGEAFEVTYPEDTKVDVRGSILCQGSVTKNGGLLINGSTQITPGQAITVQTELVTVVINITDIEIYTEG